jgi:hypothetical protein
VVRDHQRAAVYRAEALAFTDTLLDVPIGLEALQTLAGVLFVEPWWRRTTGEVAPRVRAARADATHSVAALDAAGGWVVRIAPGHDQVVTLSHESAHVLAAIASGPAPPAGGAHGPLFRAAHVAVATVLLGPHGAGLLSTAYRNARLEQLIPPPWVEPPTPDDEHGLYGRWRRAIAL